MKLRSVFVLLLAFSLSACGLDQIQIFPDEYVSDQFSIFSTTDSYALGTEVRFEMSVADGETREPSVEILGTALRIDETDADGIVHATTVEVGSGEIIYRIGGDEIRRYPFVVGAVERIAVEHYALDGEAGFELENGQFDRNAFSIAMGASYGLVVRYEDADGNRLAGAGLLSAEGGTLEPQHNRDTIHLNTSAAGESSVVLSAGDATLSVTYDVVDQLASLMLEEDFEVDDVIAIHPRAMDIDGRRVYGKPDWRIDGEEHSLTVVGFGFDTGFVAFEPSATERHIVEASLLGTTASIEAGFIYP